MNPLQCVIANEQFRPQQPPTEILHVMEEVSNECNGCDNVNLQPEIRSQTPTNRPLIDKPSTSETPVRQKRKRKIGTGTPNIKEVVSILFKYF